MPQTADSFIPAPTRSGAAMWYYRVPSDQNIARGFCVPTSGNDSRVTHRSNVALDTSRYLRPPFLKLFTSLILKSRASERLREFSGFPLFYWEFWLALSLNLCLPSSNCLQKRMRQVSPSRLRVEDTAGEDNHPPFTQEQNGETHTCSRYS